MSDIRPEKGEQWEVISGNGVGTLLTITDVPETTSEEGTFVLFTTEGKSDPRQLPLDERWGSSLIRRAEASDDAPGRSTEVAEQVAHDRLVRIGVANYGAYTAEEAVLKVLTDFFIWKGRGEATLSEIESEAVSAARRVHGD